MWEGSTAGCRGLERMGEALDGVEGRCRGPQGAHQGLARDCGGVVRDAEGGGAVAARTVSTQPARDDDTPIVVGGARVAEGVVRVASVVHRSGSAVVGGAASAAESTGVGEVSLPLRGGVGREVAGAGTSAGAGCRGVWEPGGAVSVGVTPIISELVWVVVHPGEAADVVICLDSW